MCAMKIRFSFPTKLDSFAIINQTMKNSDINIKDCIKIHHFEDDNNAHWIRQKKKKRKYGQTMGFIEKSFLSIISSSFLFRLN